jgi:hypothetical protein
MSVISGNFLIKRALPLLAALTLASGSAGAAVVNGNFETGPFGVAPAGWTVMPGTEIYTLQGGDYIPCCGASGTPAQLANHFVTFGPGNVANISTLSQLVATITGATYTLTFDQGVMGGGTQTLFANVFDGSEPLITSGSWTQSANNALGSTFVTRSLTFVAESNSSRIQFYVDQNSENVDGILDNVTLTAAVPEPATWALMLIGFGAVGSTMRRRRAARPSFA